MPDSTYEEAKRCPKCKEPGQQTGTKPGKNNTTLHEFTCKNERCRWCNSAPWIVQVNPDGTIPPPNLHRAKMFPALPQRSQEAIDAANQRLLDAQLSGGAEIRG